MTDRKFFSGLTDGMMTRNKNGPNRQQTNFYWPNETDTEEFVPTRNRMRNRSMSTASLMSQSQVSTDNEESRQRNLKQNKSKIEFYDMVDNNSDTESIYSQADTRRQKKQETLKSRIEFYDFVDTKNSQPDDDVQSVIERPFIRNLAPSVDHNISVTSENCQKNDEKSRVQVKNDKQAIDDVDLSQSIQNMELSHEPKNGYSSSYAQQEKPRRKGPQSYADSFSESDDDERFHRNSNSVVDDRRYPPPQQHRYPPSQRSVRSHPRRQNSEYFDFDDDEYDRHYDSARRPRYRKPESIPRMVRRRDYSPEVSDEDLYDNVDGYRRDYRPRERPPPDDRYRSNASRLDDTESYYRGRSNRRPTNGNGSEVDYHRESSRESRRPASQNSNSNPNQSSPTESHSNGYANEAVQQRMPASARPPIKPLIRTMSINEAKQRQQVNLKSNIFHTDPDYNQIVEQRKPLSVRDFAGRQRVGVGLPDI